MERIANQYRIIAAGAGWIDRSARGRLKFAGKDARAFLQALVTNDLDAIAAGSGIDAAYLTPQGRMIAMLRILVSASDLLVEAAPGQAADLATRFDQLIFTEQVTVSDITDATAVLDVVGSDAASRRRARDRGRPRERGGARDARTSGVRRHVRRPGR